MFFNYNEKFSKLITLKINIFRLSKWTIDDIKPVKSPFTQISVHSFLNYKEDKHLEKALIVDKDTEQIVKRSDSSKSRRPSVINMTGDFSKALMCNNFILQPGINNFTVIKRVDQPGYYKISQLSLLINENLEFRSRVIKPRLCYQVKKTSPSVSINSRDLVAGLVQEAELIVSSGSISIEKNAKLKLWTQRGLTIKAADSIKSLENELEITLAACEPFGILKYKLKVFADLPPKKDSSSMEHKVF